MQCVFFRKVRCTTTQKYLICSLIIQVRVQTDSHKKNLGIPKNVSSNLHLVMNEGLGGRQCTYLKQHSVNTWHRDKMVRQCSKAADWFTKCNIWKIYWILFSILITAFILVILIMICRRNPDAVKNSKTPLRKKFPLNFTFSNKKKLSVQNSLNDPE